MSSACFIFLNPGIGITPFLISYDKTRVAGAILSSWDLFLIKSNNGVYFFNDSLRKSLLTFLMNPVGFFQCIYQLRILGLVDSMLLFLYYSH